MNPDASAVGSWVLVAVMLLSAGASLTVILGSRRTQRRSVALEESYATLPHVQRVERELGARIDGVDGDVRALKDQIVANGEVRRKSIEAKVETVREETRQVAVQVAGLQSETRIFNQRLVQIDDKLDRMRDRGSASFEVRSAKS